MELPGPYRPSGSGQCAADRQDRRLRIRGREAARIAAVMGKPASHHAQVGSAFVKLAGWHASGDNAALDRAADRLGAEIIDLAAELTAWRVIAAGEPVSRARLRATPSYAHR